MMTQMTATMLTPPYNYAVVQLPDRAFPGIVVQGDSMSILVRSLEGIVLNFKNGETEDIVFDLTYVADALRSSLVNYEAVCTNLGLELPYMVPFTTDTPPNTGNTTDL
jgi:hypothetical protein